jgi:hypothetical protein
MIAHIQDTSSGMVDTNFRTFALNVKTAVTAKLQGVTFQTIVVLRLAVQKTSALLHKRVGLMYRHISMSWRQLSE